MAYRPHPNRDRALHQLARGRVVSKPQAQPTFAEMLVYLQSDEHRQKMRRLGWTASEFLQRWQAALGAKQA